VQKDFGRGVLPFTVMKFMWRLLVESSLRPLSGSLKLA
jgi:hypothetical protein